MKRRRPGSTVSSYHPRRLKVPSDETDWNEICQNPLIGAYESHNEWILDDRIRRPLPSSSVLTAMQPSTSTTTTLNTQQQRGLSMPLLQPLQHLFVVGKKPSDASPEEHQQQDEDDQDDEPPYDDLLNNPDFSTLTIGRHKRYLQLLQHDQQRKTANTRKEFQTLKRLVKQEQELYRTKLQEFFEIHMERYRVGIPSLFAEYNGHVSKLYKEQLNDSDSASCLFGSKCRQIISLLHVSREIRLMHANKNKSSRSMDEYSSQVVWNNNEEKMLMSLEDCDALKQGTSIVPPSTDKIPTIQFIQNDKIALELCREHNIDILTTQETLQTLLQLPGDDGVEWRIPVFKQQHFVILDLPLPGPSNPRQCLTDGVREGLYQQIIGSPPDATSYSYSLVTLPSTTTTTTTKQSTQRRRVLVRTLNRIVESTDNPQQRRPVRLLPKLEYFCDHHYQEIHTAYDKALWILDKILQPSCRVLVVHVDPCQKPFRVVSTKEVSVAHAMAGEQEGWIDKTPAEVSPMDHLEAMTEVLRATQSLPDGDLLLQLSSGATSVSVHVQETNGALNVQKLVEEVGGVVYTGPAALRQCIRTFQWDEDRVPFTFPVRTTK